MRISNMLLFLALLILLHIFLSSRQSKWPGLIFPGLSFLFSLIYPLNMTAPASIFQILLVWFIGNIPTLILLGIYYACRGKYRRAKQMEKMNIQDL